MGNLLRVDTDEEVSANGGKASQPGIDANVLVRTFPIRRIDKLHGKSSKNKKFQQGLQLCTEIPFK